VDRAEHLLVATSPGLLVLAYCVAKTRMSWRNEALWTAFFLGGLGTVATLPFEFAVHWLADFAALTPVVKAGVLAVFSAAIVEETTKYLILVGAAEPHVDARRRQDLISLAVAVSLGFATVENFFALLAPPNWQFVGAARALSAVPGHAIFGLAMGALLTAARIEPSRRVMWIALALIIPAIMHAAYDFPLFLRKFGVTETGTLPWFTVIWPATLLAIAITAIGLCNWILPAARQADLRSGRDLRTDPPALPLIVVGCVLLVAVLTLLAAIIFTNVGGAFRSIGAAMIIFPLVLAVDLIWTGLHRRTNRKLQQPFA
jgi:RsiW-degrading membrane proteinase PrsW (M82 family)